MPAFRIAAWPAHSGLHLYPLLYLDPEWLGAVPVSFHPLPFLVATETWSSAELRGRPGAALGEGRHQSIASSHSASRTILASSALDYQAPAKATKVSSVPFFSTRWWQAARHLRSLKTLLLKIGKARSSPLMPCSYSAELSTLSCWKAPVDHGNNPANHFVWYHLENLVLFVAWLSLQINAARLIKCSQLTVQAIN